MKTATRLSDSIISNGLCKAYSMHPRKSQQHQRTSTLFSIFRIPVTSKELSKIDWQRLICFFNTNFLYLAEVWWVKTYYWTLDMGGCICLSWNRCIISYASALMSRKHFNFFTGHCTSEYYLLARSRKSGLLNLKWNICFDECENFLPVSLEWKGTK